MSGHVVSLKVYFTIFFSLMFLTAVTVWASYVDLGSMNIVVALAIAIFKATLVILYFMHLRHSERLTWVMVAVGVTWLGFMIGLTLSDILTRGWVPGALG